MEARRIFQTTVVHALRPEFSVAALFVGAEFPAEGGAEAVCGALGIEPLSGGEISSGELRRVLACVLTGSLEVFDMNPRAFQFYVNQSGIEEGFLDHVLSAARLVVARGGGPPGAQSSGPGGPGGALAAQTLDGLLADSLAAGLGFYGLGERDRLHDVSGRQAIELMFLILPEGLLLAGSQRGLDRALHFGLYERLHQAFIAPQVPGAPGGAK
jgi:hypothetical protein